METGFQRLLFSAVFVAAKDSGMSWVVQSPQTQ